MTEGDIVERNSALRAVAAAMRENCAQYRQNMAKAVTAVDRVAEEQRFLARADEIDIDKAGIDAQFRKKYLAHLAEGGLRLPPDVHDNVLRAPN